jgi:thioredoxin-related protein
MRRIASVLFLSLAAGMAGADETGWIMDDYQKGLETAKKSGHLMQIDWTAEWCGWCKKLEAETYADPEVAKYIAATFVNVRLDKDNAKNGDLAEKMKVEGIPALIFVDGDGRVVGRIEGFKPAGPYLKAVKEIQANGEKLVKAEAALKKDAKDLASSLAVGQVLASAGDWAGAEPHLKAVLEGDADNAKKLAVGAWFELGKHSGTNGNLKDVKEAQEKVKGFDPEGKLGWNDDLALLAGRAEVMGDSDKERELYRKIVADFPKSDSAAEAAFYLAAMIADVDEDLDGAAAAFTQFAKDYPGTEWADQVPQILKNIENAKAAHDHK